jgi:hypothetical protein
MKPSPLKMGKELTDGEYDTFVRLAGNELKDDGVGMHDALKEMVKDPDYKNEPDAMKAAMITNTVNVYRRLAIVQMLEPDAQRRESGLMASYNARVNQKSDALAGPDPAAAAPLGGLLKMPQ